MLLQLLRNKVFVLEFKGSEIPSGSSMKQLRINRSQGIFESISPIMPSEEKKGKTFPHERELHEASPRRRRKKDRGFFYWMKEAIHQTIGQKRETTAEVVCYKITSFFLPSFLIMACNIPLTAVSSYYVKVLVYK